MEELQLLLHWVHTEEHPLACLEDMVECLAWGLVVHHLEDLLAILHPHRVREVKVVTSSLEVVEEGVEVIKVNKEAVEVMVRVVVGMAEEAVDMVEVVVVGATEVAVVDMAEEALEVEEVEG